MTRTNSPDGDTSLSGWIDPARAGRSDRHRTGAMMSTLAVDACRRRRASSLPAEISSFVGRRQEIVAVKRLLSESRMVTLIGVGGVGKTRLALKVAASLRRAFPDGAWFVELAALDRPEPLIRTITATLEIRDHSSRPPLEVLTDRLDGKRMLIILDNCEHLVDACAVVADALLSALPNLHILATSRQPLTISSERTLSVPPMTLPNGDGERTGASTPSDAIRLFGERAAAVLPGFAVTDDNRDVVERICRRLDGIPLALELAAVRLRTLSAQELLDRLDDRFRLLTTGSRTVPPRHQTLRALIEWSHALCTAPERLLWARISVFHDGLDLAAAEAVCAGDGIPREEVIDLVTGLVEKSVLIREEHASGVRYRLLDVTRAYGRERLAASGQEATFRRRYRDYYRDMAADASARLFSPSQIDLVTRLRAECPNLRAAMEYSYSDPDDVPVGLSIASDLRYHWISSHSTGEGRGWFEQGLARYPRPDAIRARALWACSWLALVQGDVDAARSMLWESRAIGERLGLKSVQAYVWLFSGMVAVFGGDVETAITCYERAAARHRATGDLAGLALSLIRLSLARFLRGDVKRAVATAEECLSLCEARGEGWHKAYTTIALGIEVWLQGDPRRAASLERDALRFTRALDDRLGAAVSLEVLAWIAAADGDPKRAARLLGIRRRAWPTITAPLSGYGNLIPYHDDCECRTREALGEEAFRATVRNGAGMPDGEALAYALGRPVPASPGPAPGANGIDPGSPLTHRETEVARLIAEGMSNKEIAVTLVIAQRTVEGHVEHILDKLGFNCRAQIARWITEHRETGDRPAAPRSLMMT